MMEVYRDGEYGVYERTKTVDKHNPISGHRWTEEIKQNGFEVSGGNFYTGKYHRTLKGAKNEIELRKKVSKLFGEKS